MIVRHTQLLADYFSENQLDLARFVERFTQWKQEGEDSSYFFGKDAYFVKPDNIKHVHLVPILDQEALTRWDQNWENGSRRTSDRFLLYVEDNQRFLLLAILPEPTAHAFVRMENPQSRSAMTIFSEAAEQFIYHDLITL